MVQTLLGYGVVALAAVYVGWKFMPAALRSWLAACIGALMRSWGLASDSAASLETKLRRGGACGSCDSCNACHSAKHAIEPSAIRMVANAAHPPEA